VTDCQRRRRRHRHRRGLLRRLRPPQWHVVFNKGPPFGSLPPSNPLVFLPRFLFLFFQSSAELSSRRRRRRLPSISKSNVGDDSGQPAIYPAMHIKPHDLYLYFGLTGISVYAGYTVCVSQPEGGTYLTSQSEILDPIPIPIHHSPFNPHPRWLLLIALFPPMSTSTSSISV